MTIRRRTCLLVAATVALACGAGAARATDIGKEVAIPRHLQDGEEYTLPVRAVVAHGHDFFAANWTGQEGGGRPLTKGTGAPLADPASR